MPTRRSFLQAGLAAGTTLGVAGQAQGGDAQILEMQDWRQYLGDPMDANSYGQPSKFQADVVRGRVDWLTPDDTTAVSFTPLQHLDGTITPSGLCFERHHGGIAQVDAGQHRLMINGLVDQPLIFTMQDLQRFPRISRTYFLECAANSGMEWRGAQMDGVQYTHGMIHNVEYTGVLLRDILNEAGIKPAGKWLLAEGADAAGMSRSIPLDKALDDCLIAFKMNGEALRAEQGYPIRLVVPGWEGNMWIKWLRRLEIGDQPWHHREESSKYSDLMADGRTRRFTWEMDAKSVITSPSPEMPVLHGKGPMVLSGLAWSGRGHIPRVDVSLDGGANWHPARMSGQGGDKALHRFYYDFNWDGTPLLLQSRAHDSSGYVQPTKDALRKFRGLNSNYHNNGIQTWHLLADGRLENVEVS